MIYSRYLFLTSAIMYKYLFPFQDLCFIRYFCCNKVKCSNVYHSRLCFCVVLKIPLLGSKFYFHIYSSKYLKVSLITFKTLMHSNYYVTKQTHIFVSLTAFQLHPSPTVLHITVVQRLRTSLF